MGAPAPLGSAIGKVLGLAGAGVAAWFTAESAKGRMPEWQRQVNNHHVNLSMDEMQYHWGHYSGQPAMDTWAGKFKRAMLFGPWGLKTTWHKIKTYTEGFVNDVLLKNFIPIAAGIGGLYATGFKPHKLVSEPYKYLKRVLPKPKWNIWGTRLVDAGKRMLGGMEGAARVAAKNPAIALAIGALGAFGLYRFSRVYNHDEQHDFFSGQINGSDH